MVKKMVVVFQDQIEVEAEDFLKENEAASIEEIAEHVFNQFTAEADGIIVYADDVEEPLAALCPDDMLLGTLGALMQNIVDVQRMM